MCEDADITISVQLPNGPKTQQQQTKLPKDEHPFCIVQTGSKKLVFEGKPGGNCTQWGCVKFDGIGDPNHLLFFAIQATSTTYKDSCGKERNGIVYSAWDPTGVSKCEPTKCEATPTGPCDVLDKPHVYVARILQPLCSIKGLRFQVNGEMLNCSTEADKKKVVISIAWGVGTFAQPPECTHAGVVAAKGDKAAAPCPPCAATAP